MARYVDFLEPQAVKLLEPLIDKHDEVDSLVVAQLSQFSIAVSLKRLADLAENVYEIWETRYL